MEQGKGSKEEFLRAEYSALSDYFGKVITFRFNRGLVSGFVRFITEVSRWWQPTTTIEVLKQSSIVTTVIAGQGASRWRR